MKALNIMYFEEMLAQCLLLMLTAIRYLETDYRCISTDAANVANPLKIGIYTMDDKYDAYLDGDRLFQRHAAVVGSTGSGKSYCVARTVEQMADLPNASSILFDIHGEYSTDSFKKEGVVHYKIATPSDFADYVVSS